MTDSVATKTVNATKWSLFSQIISKLINPVTQLILAHLLAPEVFGVVALVNIVVSFADMFSDAGFQKYLIQHEYDSKEEIRHSANVAFWTNMTISLLLWLLIAVMRNPIAETLGDISIAIALVVACASLPLTALISVQTAMYQRDFDFKVLFYSRVFSSAAVMIVSVTLAFFGFGYWSIIIGTIASNLVLAIWLTVCSVWRPEFSFDFDELKRMFSFSAWTLLEAFSIWVTNWIGAFILGSMMNTYYLGLYNTSVSLVTSFLAIVANAVNPVIFASLSRLQMDRNRFDKTFYLMQKCLGFFIVPMAVFLFIFREAIIGLYLGDAWLEAADFFGLYSLASALVVVFGHTASDAFRALGRPRLSLLTQIGFLLFIVPSLIIGSMQGFDVLTWIVPVFRVFGSLFVQFMICKVFVDLSPLKMIYNMRWVYFASFLNAGLFFVIIEFFNCNYFLQCILAVIAVGVYFCEILLIRDLRETLFFVIEKFGFREKIEKIPGLKRITRDM